MAKLNGLKISLCQMRVLPGRPDINTAYIVAEIKSAAARGADIAVFPEMATTGYLVGDIFEDFYFINDVVTGHQRDIVAATKKGVTAIFGGIKIPFDQDGMKKGEDGRQRMHNAGIVAVNGQELGYTVKTLQPNYRFFDDDKHMFSLRKMLEESNAEFLSETTRDKSKAQKKLDDFLKVFSVPTKIGVVRVGVMLCEDMWHIDYALNPAKVLSLLGADIIVNLSASPWSWQKNRKRHQVVRELLSECQIPFCYVNNTGVQNAGKNLLAFDGSSTIYSKTGEIIFEIPPYHEGSHDFVFIEPPSPVPEKQNSDTEDLYNAMICATRAITPENTKIVIGLSGGIDSAAVAAHFVDVFGPEKVIAVNMPFHGINSPESQELARQIAENLSVEYRVEPINDLVRATCERTKIRENTLAFENVQARARMTILAGVAAETGGVFTCNTNKVEAAFGYGTLYGDLAGFYAPLHDLVKREVRQVADYLNRIRFKKEVIPAQCIAQIPTAELKKNQKDPFDYGGLDRRGYHDEMVRAITEFRRNPEWFLELYMGKRLEGELKLEKKTLSSLFPTAEDFIEDLEKHWNLFFRSYFKRNQATFIPVFSKRAFGRDLEESLLSPYLTTRYRMLKETLLSNPNAGRRIIIYGGAFRPPCFHHREIAERLRELGRVVIVPSGTRKEKPSTSLIASEDCKAMIEFTFEGLGGVEIDFYDLEENIFTPTYVLREKYAAKFPKQEIWFAIGADLISRGRDRNSEIEREWMSGREIWNDLRFVVVQNPAEPFDENDLPPNSMLMRMPVFIGRSSTVRERIAKGEPIEGLVMPKVEEYIKKKNLFK